MAAPKAEITYIELEKFAWDYIKECLNNTKQHPTASGKIALIKDRHIPTISYFLKIWLPMQGKPTISRSTYYNWLNTHDDAKLDTIKRIEGYFEALAIDIVANEGKGIFYAKNKLGMTDRQAETETFKPILINANFGQTLLTNDADNK
ncbi:MAG: hypothetical protein ACK4XL_02235 [Bacteroidota bacterium]|jgi:hypothetical protein